jgi:hypothetical protein
MSKIYFGPDCVHDSAIHTTHIQAWRIGIRDDHSSSGRDGGANNVLHAGAKESEAF